MKRNNKKGFTIVELVIVIGVIAILAAVMIPTFSGIIQKAEDSKALQNARNAYTEALVENPSAGYTVVCDGTNHYDVTNEFAKTAHVDHAGATNILETNAADGE